MKPIYLFEAGGTKTSLIIDDGNKTETFIFPGFNPNRYSSEFETELKKIVLPSNAQVYFYGSGLVSDENKNIVRALFGKRNIKKIEVFDDQLGAARAAYGSKNGLIAIMGTGAFGAWYDGEKLVDRRGGHGYLIDDIGGGLELGKVILSKWLNNDLPEDVDEAISNLIQSEKLDFTTIFYKNPNLKLLAEIPQLVLPYLTLPSIDELLQRYFLEFFNRHINPILLKHPSHQLRIVGGLATGFHSVIAKTALLSGILDVGIIANPGQDLVAFHRK